MVMGESILVQETIFKGSGCMILVGKLQFLGLLGYVGEGGGSVLGVWGECVWFVMSGVDPEWALVVKSKL